MKGGTERVDQESSSAIALRVGRLAGVAAFITLIGGALVLAGWAFDVYWLANPTRDRPSPMPATATIFALSGLSLLVRRAPRRWPAVRAIGLACAWATLLVGIGVLAEYALNRSLWIDQLIMQAPPAVPGGAPGRPAANTALCMTFLGFALLLSRVRVRRYWVPEVFALGILLIAFISIAAHAFGQMSAGGVVQLAHITTMSLTTSTLFVTSAFAVLFQRPSEGLMGIVTSDLLGGFIARRLVLGVIAIPIVTFAAEYSERRGWIDEMLSGTLVSLFATSFTLALVFLTGFNVNRLDLERRRKEDELQLWKHFFEHAEFGAAIGGADMRYQLVNASFARMHGMTVEECVGRPIPELFTPEARKVLPREVERIHELGHYSFESEHLRKDGSAFPVYIDATAVRDAAGNVRYRAVVTQDITERKRAEAERGRLAAIADGTDDAIFSSTLDGIITTWNRAAERLFGYTAAEIIGQSGAILTPANKMAERADYLEKMRRGEHLPAFETVRLCKDGTSVPLLATVSAILNASGKPDALSVIAHDISARKRMEEELRQSEARTSQLFMDAVDAIFVANIEGRIIDVNASGSRLLQFSREEIVGRLMSDCLRSEDVPRLMAGRERLLRGEALTDQWGMRRKDGTVVPVECSTKILPDGRWQAFIRDITERKAMEDALRQSEERTRQLFESAPDGIFLADADRRFVDVNASGCELLRTPREALVGLRPSDFLASEELPRLTEFRERQVKGEIVVGEWHIRRGDGSYVPVEVCSRYLSDGRWLAFFRDITERQRAEALIRQSEERMRQLFESAVEGIFVADINGRYMDVNESACRLLQLKKEEIIGRTIGELIPPDERPQLEEARKMLLSGKSQTAEWRLRRRDGVYIPVETNAKILPDGRWQGFVRDITERKEAERALRVARDDEQRLRLQIEALSRADRDISEAIARAPGVDLNRLLDVILLHAQEMTNARYVAIGIGGDEQHPFESWAQRGVSQSEAEAIGHTPRPVGLLGYPVRTGEAVRLGDLHKHPDYRGFPANHPEMTRLLAVPVRYRERSVGNLYLADKTDGTEFTAEDQRVVEVLADRAGLAIETVTLYAQTNMQRIWLQSVVEHLPEATVVVDAAGRVIAHSRSADRFRTTTSPDFWGNTEVIDLRDSVTRAPLERQDHPIERALREREETVRRELSIRLSEDRFVPVLVSVAMIRDATEKNIGAILLLQDVSAMKELERLREEWMAIVAHDLRQPVATIRASAELLRRTAARTEMGERILSSLDRISSSSTRLGRMITDLLDASRLEARHLKLEHKEFDLHELVRAVLGRMNELFEGRPVRVIAPSDPVILEADPDRIEQVLTNLLSNAVKYGAPGSEITVEITTGDGTAGVKVTNAGHGISPEMVGRLFDRFERAWAPRESRAPGIGLGLYICKGLVEAHRGRVWVDSTPDQTTTFGFELPVHPAEAGARPTEPLSPGPVTPI